MAISALNGSNCGFCSRYGDADAVLFDWISIKWNKGV